MLTKEQVEELLVDTHPEDGFRVLDVVVGDRHALYIVFRNQGVRVDLPGRQDQAYLVWLVESPLPAQLGEKARVKLLLDAMCRYVNTGGESADICDWGEKLKFVCNGAGVTMPGDYVLIDSEINAEGNYEHLFQSPQSTQIVRWVEGQFFDVFSMNTLQKEKAAHDADEYASRSGALEAAEAGDPAYVPDSECAGHEEPAETGDPGALRGQAAEGS